MKVQLLFFSGCPNVDEAREMLQEVLQESGVGDQIEEIDTSSSDAGDVLRGWGSPTILIDGEDVAGEREPTGTSCRLYQHPDGIRGVPPGLVVRNAVRKARGRGSRWITAFGAIPGAVLPLLPSFACPACVAAYAGVLSTLGLGVVLTEKVLAPVIILFLGLGILSVAWSTRSHRHPGPFVATLSGAVAVVIGRLIWNVPAALYAGVALLILASLWNLWLKRPRPQPLIQLRHRRTEGRTS